MFSHLILPQHRLILSRCSGGITAGNLLEYFEQVTRDPYYDSRFDGLIDIRRVSAQITPTELKAFVNTIREDPRQSTGRRAFLSADQQGTALGYLYGQLLDGQRSVNVFSTVEAALDWLRQSAEPDEIEGHLGRLA